MLLMKIEQYGTDAISRILQRIKRTTLTLPCTEVTDKLSQDIWRDDGSLFSKQVPVQLTKQMMMTGNFWKIAKHPCCYAGMDKGSENLGTGKGLNGQTRRNAFIGSGSALHQMFVTREAIDAVKKRQGLASFQTF